MRGEGLPNPEDTSRTTEGEADQEVNTKEKITEGKNMNEDLRKGLTNTKANLPVRLFLHLNLND